MSNPAMERSERLESLAYRLRKRKQISQDDMLLIYDAAHGEWDDALHFEAPWKPGVSLCGEWYRNLIPMDDRGDVGGARCWTCLHTRDWLAEKLPDLIAENAEALPVSVPSRQADEALDEQIEMLRHMIRSSRPHSGSEEAHDAWDDAIDKAYAVLDTVRDELGRLRRLEDGLREELESARSTDPLENAADPDAALYLGPHHEGYIDGLEFARALLAGADEPDGGGAK